MRCINYIIIKNPDLTNEEIESRINNLLKENETRSKSFDFGGNLYGEYVKVGKDIFLNSSIDYKIDAVIIQFKNNRCEYDGHVLLIHIAEKLITEIKCDKNPKTLISVRTEYDDEWDRFYLKDIDTHLLK